MFKRNLLKRTLPIMLSVAMTFQSVPITAMAAENPPAAVEQEAAESEAEPINESVEESAAETAGESTVETPEEPAAETAGESTAETPDESATETSGESTVETPEESATEAPAESGQTPETAPEGTAGEESVPTQDTGAVSDSAAEADGQENAGTENETEESADVSAETAEPEAAEEAGTVVPEIKVPDYVYSNIEGYGFTLQKGESDRIYSGEYAPDKLVGVKDQVKNETQILVNGENPIDQSYLSVEWQVKSGEAWTDMLEAPENVGDYRLALAVEKVEGVCEAAESVYIYFNIVPKELSFEYSGTVKAGDKIEDFIADIKENGKVARDAENADYLDKLQYSLSVAVSKAGESAATTDVYFSNDADYYYTVTVELEESIKDNYTLNSETEYRVVFEGLRKTQVEAVLTKLGTELAKQYQSGTSWQVGDFLKAGDVTVTVKVESKEESEDGDAGQEPTFVPAGDAEKAELGEPAAKWYIKETFSADDFFDSKDIDEKTQFYLENGDRTDVYTLLPEDTISEVGEYYIVYVCEGKADKFEGSHSDPIQVTINPISVILKPESAGDLKFGMDKTAVDGALSKVTSGLYVTADGMTAGDSDKVTEPGVGANGFYGVSYDNAGKTQYYTPVFELWYRSKEKTATEWEWAEEPLVSLESFKPDTEKYEYQYYIVFTGKKAVYNANGTKGYYILEDGEVSWVEDDGIDITETSTNTANQNYKVVADEDVRFNVSNALEVKIEDAVETTVDTTKIVAAFNGIHGYAASGSGAMDKPARMVYDPDTSLFAEREGETGYKLAEVKDKEGNPVTVDRGELTYVWQQLDNVEGYQEFINTTEPADKESEEYAAWAALKEELESDSAYRTWPIDYSTLTPRDAGVYRLKIDYKDSKAGPEYAPSVGSVYFLIEKQELVLKADPQYAEYDEEVGAYRNKWYGYGVFKVPGNNAAANLEPLDWNADAKRSDWYAMTRDKNEAGVDIGDLRVMDDDETFIKDERHPYTYKAAVWLDDENLFGYITEKSTGVTTALNWKNYTTRNQHDWDAEAKEYRQHTAGFADILFGMDEITFDVNGVVSADKVYDGKPIAAANPLTVTTSAGLAADEAQDAVSGVKLGWRWRSEDGSDVYVDKVVTTAEAIYGGTYTLVASFKGNEEYKALTEEDEDGLYRNTKEWQTVRDKDGNSYAFTIKPREVEIAPKLKTQVTAGTPLREMLEEGIETKNVAEGDEWLFAFGSGIKEDATVIDEAKRMVGYDGYPILSDAYYNYEDIDEYSGDFEGDGDFHPAYFVDNEEWRGRLIRAGKNYSVEFEEAPLFAQYALSYKITYKTAALTKEQIVRGDAEVWSTWFFYDGFEEDADKGSVEVDHKKIEEDPHKFTITPLEGIPFIYNSYEIWGADINKDITGREIPRDKNYIAVDIVSPFEFSDEIDAGDISYGKDHFLYETSIRNAGGYVINEKVDSQDLSDDPYWNGTYNRYLITALFPVERGQDGKAVSPNSFEITWEKGYKETFTWDMSAASLEDNLKEAVAPKSMAFNGLVNKMAVGEEQQLDVKITKMQLGDVIRVNYRVAAGGENYASVNPETGRMTALSVGTGKSASVTVEAYPVRLGADGKTFEEITTDANGKAVKPATAKITINNVTAPVIKKLTAEDNTIEVQYTKVNDGYRREIYVKEIDKDTAKTYSKPDGFENDIKQIENGQWKGTFAIAPRYVYGRGEEYDSKLKVCVEELWNLKADASYAVYVRNVSAVRTLTDGSKVEESVAGTVKTINTTKSMVKGLKPYFNVAENPSDRTVDYIKEGDPEAGYIVDLADKSAQLFVMGDFSRKVLDNGKEAEDDEWIRITLPIKTTVKAASQNAEVQAMLSAYPDIPEKYLEPKISYYITDYKADKYELYFDGQNNDFDDKGKLKNPSKYATIAKNGKITLKGVGENGYAMVTLWAVSDNKVQGSCDLIISAKPDSVTAKKVKAMKVGDGIRLADYLEYKQDGKKIPNYWSSNIVITNWDEVEKAGFEIHQVDDNDAVYESDNTKGEVPVKCYRYKSVDDDLNLGEYIITAVKENASCTLRFTDRLNGSEQSGDIALSSTQLDPVKGLKTAYVDDKHITLNFTYAGHPDAFAIEVKDARGSVIFKRLAKVEDAMRNAVWAEDLVAAYWKDDGKGPWLQNEQTGIIGAPLGYYGSDVCFKYFEKTKTYAYTVKTEKLIRLSSYTISVDPVYNGVSGSGMGGKLVTTKAKTTNIPASYGNADVQNPVWQYIGEYDDKAIDIRDAYGRQSGPYFISGNTYTLTTDVNNLAAKDRGTDTLTWKSSNTKVISLKANQGSYSATLKAMQQGRATITVTSKITKKTIARFHVAVKAVGDGKNYGGDFEYSGNIDGSQTPFYDSFIKTYDPYYEGKLEELTVTNPVNVTEDELLNYPGLDNSGVQNPYINHTWVKFTAPAYGEYTFQSTQVFAYYYGDKTRVGGISDGYLANLKLEKGQKLYFKVPGAFTLKVAEYTDFTKLTLGKPITATKDTWVSFTAPEDNYYTFSGGDTFEKDGVDITYDMASNDDSKSIGLKAGKTIFILVKAGDTLTVEKRDLSAALNKGENSVSFQKDEEGKAQYQYRTFTAPVTGDYTFEYPAENVDVKFYSADGETEYGENGDKLGVTAKTVLLAEGETTTPQEPKTTTKTLFIEEGQTVVVEIMVEDGAFTDEAQTFEVPITVSGIDVGGISGTETEVEKEKSQTFEYTIPQCEEVTQYTVKADGARITWYNAAYEEITISGNKFVVEDGAVRGNTKIKEGDKIYIKVDATYAAENVKVSITSKTAKAVDAPTDQTVVLQNGSEDWYTFTVKKAGYYEFTYGLGESPKHGISVEQYDKAFGTQIVYDAIEFAQTSERLYYLETGSYTFKVEASGTADKAEDTTNATISVKEVTAEPLKADNNPVALGSKDEVKYYSFKAADSLYTIKWVPDKDTGAATVEYMSDDMGGVFRNLSENGLTMDANVAYCFRVKQTEDTKVSGNLQITGGEKAENLISKVAKTFAFKDGEPDSITYRFTTPEDNNLGYAVIVENTSTSAEENGSVPNISVFVGNDYNGYSSKTINKGMLTWDQMNWKSAYETYFIRVSVDEMLDNAEAAGKITVQPITPTEFTKQDGKIAQGDSKWYVYTVPADGRYSLDYELGENQTGDITLAWYKKVGKMVSRIYDREAQYLKKDATIYVNVKGDDIAADGIDVTVSLDAMEIDKLGKLELAADATTAEVELTDETPDYYTFTAHEDASYTIGGNIYWDDVVMFTPEDGSRETHFSNGQELKAGETILIRVGHSGKLTVTKKLVETLELDKASSSKKLLSGESARFAFTTYTGDYYEFKTSVQENIGVEVLGYYDEVALDGYALIEGEKGRRWLIEVTNNSDKEVELTITAKKAVSDAVLELDKEASVSVEKGKIYLLSFAVPETYRYTVTCGEGGEIVGTDVEGNDVWYKTDGRNGSKYLKLRYNGEEDTATVNVTVSKLVPEEMQNGEAEVSLNYNKTKWFAYTIPKAGEYAFGYTGSEVYAQLYEDLNTEDYTYADNSIVKEAGDVIYVKVVGRSSAEEPKTEIFFETPVELELDRNISVPVKKGRIRMLKFAVPETYRYTVTCSGDGQIIETDVTGGNIWYQNESRLLKLQYNGEADAAKINVRVSKLVPEEMQDGEATVSLNYNESKWFAYTVPEAGEYMFGYSGDEVYATLYEDLKTYYGTPGYNSVVKEAGDVIYVKVDGRNYADYPKTTIFFATPIVLELDQEISVPVKRDRTSLLKFEVPETYRYTVTCSEGGEIVGTDVNGDQIWNENETRSLTLQYNGEADTVTVKVSKLKPEEMQGDSVEVSLNNGESKWFAYTVPKTGKYKFRSASSSGSFSTSLYEDLSSWSYVYDYSNIEKEAGDVIYVQVTNSSSYGEADIEISFKPVFELELDQEISVSMKKGRTIELRFTVPETYRYTVTCSEGAEIVDEYGNPVDVTGNNIWTKTEEGYGPRTFELQYNGEADTATINVKVSKLKPQEMTGGEDGKDTVSLNYGESKWFAYTVPQAGEYTFKYSGSSVRAELYRSLDTWSSTYGTDPVVKKAGDVIYVKVVGNNSEAEPNTEISFTSEVYAAIVELELDQEISVPVEKDKISLLTFAVPENYRYTITCSEGGQIIERDVTNNLFLYRTSENSEPQHFKLQYDGAADTDTITVKVSKLKPAEMKDGDTVSLSPNKYQWLAYTVPKTGIYKFKATGSPVYATLYPDLRTDGSSSSDESVLKAAGDVIYVRLMGGYPADENPVTWISFESEEFQYELTLDEPLEVDNSGSSDDQYVVFKASADGFYQFSSSDSDGTHYLGAENSGWYMNSYKYFIMKDDEVFIRVDGGYNVSVTVTKTRDIAADKALSMGKSEEESIEDLGSENWYTFTPPEDGCYSFMEEDVSDSSTYAWMYLYRSGAGSYHYDNDNETYEDYANGVQDDDGNYTFGIRNFQLKKGEKVYLKVKYNRQIKYKINIKKS